MSIITSSQLYIKLKNNFYLYYILVGYDIFLLQESKNIIYKFAKKYQFNQYYEINLHQNLNWYELLYKYKSLNLINNGKLILTIFISNNLNLIEINKKLKQLLLICNKDTILILIFKQLSTSYKNTEWYKIICKSLILVNCFTPQKEQFLNWIIKRVQYMKLSLDKEVYRLLYHNYEGNLFALTQLLNQLVLIYSNNHLSINQVKLIVNNCSLFNISQWINALLLGDNKRAIHILEKLKLININKLTLLYNLQQKITTLIQLKKLTKNTAISKLINNYKLYGIKYNDLIKFIIRLTLEQLQNIASFLIKIELKFKKDYYTEFWSDCNTLILLLCRKI